MKDALLLSHLFGSLRKREKRAFIEPVEKMDSINLVHVGRPQEGEMLVEETIMGKVVCLISIPMPFPYIRQCGQDGISNRR